MSTFGEHNERVIREYNPGEPEVGDPDSAETFLGAVLNEYKRARMPKPQGAGFERFHSLHEGYAVLLEEVEELKSEVFRKNNSRHNVHIMVECVQIAAMALAIGMECLPPDFIQDIVDEDNSLVIEYY